MEIIIKNCLSCGSCLSSPKLEMIQGCIKLKDGEEATKDLESCCPFNNIKIEEEE